MSQPCSPSPCGPNSQCREVNGQAVCTCLPGFISTPPTCRPECVVSSECALNEACINQHCTDPCPGTCGLGALCNVINHNPICSCRPPFVGDPFTRCYPKRKCLYLTQYYVFVAKLDGTVEILLPHKLCTLSKSGISICSNSGSVCMQSIFYVLCSVNF